VGGAELFTGNSLMVIAWMQRKIPAGALLRNWVVVYLGNFIGSVALAFLVFLSREYLFDHGEVGKTMLNMALTKVSYPFLQALTLGILCNVLVCLAVWMTYSATSLADKVIAILFPITAFVAAGFEHSVANMYFLPLAWIINTFDPAFAASTALNLSSLTWTNILLNNLLPVTLGNLIGGVVFVGVVYALVYRPGKTPDVKQRTKTR
jgi:formate/nitrite transporter